jgi:hypothetical protein
MGDAPGVSGGDVPVVIAHIRPAKLGTVINRLESLTGVFSKKNLTVVDTVISKH